MLSLESLADLLAQYRTEANARVQEFSIQGKQFAFNSRPVIMGVINLSADSWYRESVCLTVESAVRRGKVLHAQGAQILDLGAESTLTQAARVDGRHQSQKLLPVLCELSSEGIPISVETYDSSVVRASLEAGARIINLTGQQGSEEIFRVAADYEAAVILCYVQGDNVREVGDFQMSNDPVGIMREHFARQIDLARARGVERIIIDPGLGFYYRNLQDSAIRVRHQINMFLNTFRLRSLGFPVCHALPHAFEYFGEEVRCAEPFFAMLAALGKTDLFRTHEVSKIRAVLETLSIY